MNKFNYTKDKSNKMLLLLMVVVLTITFFPKAVFARSTFDEAANDINKRIKISYYNTTQGQDELLGYYYKDIDERILEDEQDLLETCVIEMSVNNDISHDGLETVNGHFGHGKIQKIIWEIGDTTFTISQQRKYSNQNKDGVLYLPSDNEVAGYGVSSTNPSAYTQFILPILKEDPDFKDVPTYKSMKLTFAIRYVVKVALDTVFGWLSNTMGTTFDGMIGFFQDSFGMSTDYFKAIITDGVFNTSVKLFKSVGFTLTILIYLLTLYAGFFGSLGNEDNPVENVPRALIAGFLVLLSDQAMNVILEVAEVFASLFRDNAWIQSAIGNADTDSLISGLLDVKKIHIPIILNIILVIMILTEFLKLMLELIERYLVLMLQFLCAPLAFATYTSKRTSKVCSSFMSMMVSQIVVFCITMWCLNITVLLIAIAPEQCARINNPFQEMIYFFIILGFLKISQKIDRYLKDMGMTVAQTAANLGGAVMGTMAMGYAGLRMARGVGHLAKDGAQLAKNSVNAGSAGLFKLTDGKAGNPNGIGKKSVKGFDTSNMTAKEAGNFAARKMGNKNQDVAAELRKFGETGGMNGIDPKSMPKGINPKSSMGDVYKNGKKIGTMSWDENGNKIFNPSNDKGICPNGKINEPYGFRACDDFLNQTKPLNQTGLTAETLEKNGIHVPKDDDLSSWSYKGNGDGTAGIFNAHNEQIGLVDMPPIKCSDLDGMTKESLGSALGIDMDEAEFGRYAFSRDERGTGGVLERLENDGSYSHVANIGYGYDAENGGVPLDVGYGEQVTLSRTLDNAINNNAVNDFLYEMKNDQDERIFKAIGYDIDPETIDLNALNTSLSEGRVVAIKQMDSDSDVYLQYVMPGYDYVTNGKGYFLSLDDQLNLRRSVPGDTTRFYVGEVKPRKL